MSSFFSSYNTKGNPNVFEDNTTPFGQFNTQNYYQPYQQYQLYQQYQQQPKKDRAEIPSLIAVGDPIVDIISEIGTDIIKKYNMKWGDTVFLDENNDNGVYKELESMPEVRYVPGGAVENSIRVMAWCLNMDPNNKNKYKITMMGCAGDDLYRKKVMNALNELNVNILFQTLPGEKTSRCGVGIYRKERFLITQLRASKKLSEEFIQQNIQQILSHDSIIIEGYMLPNKLDLCKKLTESFVRENKFVILTLSAMFIVQYHGEKVLEIANKADMIVGNMGEVEIFSGLKGAKPKDIFETVFRKLMPKENRILVVTAGAQGSYCSRFDYKNNKLDFIFQYFANKISNEDIVDLNGAGDSFFGGFLSEYVKGSPLYDCCRIGTEAASVILRNVGCTFPKHHKFDKI
jgi:adenosine kinase